MQPYLRRLASMRIPALRTLQAAAAGLALTGLAAQPKSLPNAQPRPAEPVVLTGVKLPKLLGAKPGRLVAFAQRGGKWQPIAVQIDERVRVAYRKVLRRGSYKELTGLFYADPKTHTGADTDPSFDEDDELVLLASNFGARAPAGAPPNTKADTRTELSIGQRFAYLFDSDGTLDPSAGVDHVRYDFKLRAGDYRTEYRHRRGGNPEDSTITGTTYRLGFRDRWVLDELRITAGGANGTDLLDRHKVQIIPGNCVRTTKTFSRGGGAIIANVDGPIRAIRSVIGANSGPLTERLWVCYPRRFDVITHLRVHALPSVFIFFDYSRDALGMRYHDNNNHPGFPVDGKPDPCVPGQLEWQFLTGDQGSLEIHFRVDTDIEGLKPHSLYDDNVAPSWRQCTGDGSAFGVCGPFLSRLPNTDPRRRDANRLTSHITVYPGQPNRKCNPVELRARAPKSPKITIR